MEILNSALRQYKHNHGNGFVFGYDKDETEKIVTEILDKMKELEEDMNYWYNKYEDVIRSEYLLE